MRDYGHSIKKHGLKETLRRADRGVPPLGLAHAGQAVAEGRVATPQGLLQTVLLDALPVVAQGLGPVGEPEGRDPAVRAAREKG